MLPYSYGGGMTVVMKQIRIMLLRYKDFPYHAKNELILDISYQIFISNNQHFQEEKEGCQFEGAKVQKKMAQTKYIPEKDLFCFEYHQQTK